jgi:hypothetical protein
LRDLLGQPPDSSLRRLLRASGLVLAPLIEGVNQQSFEDLERTLNALGEAYASGRRADARRLVLEAKQHAGWAASRARDDRKRAMKQEMVTWMRVWLENPQVFPAWAQLRNRTADFYRLRNVGKPAEEEK